MYQSGRADKRLAPLAVAPGMVFYLPMDSVGVPLWLDKDLGGAVHENLYTASPGNGSSKSPRGSRILKAVRKILGNGGRITRKTHN